MIDFVALSFLLLGQPGILELPKAREIFERGKSRETVVWDDDFGRYILYVDSVFDVEENAQNGRHAIFRIEKGGATFQTSGVLINCDTKSWRAVWSDEVSATDPPYVRRRDYSRRAPSPGNRGPMGAMIKEVCDGQ